MSLADLDPSVLLTGHGLLALLTLTALELVLGIDNIIFISIISNTLERPEDRRKGQRLGLLIAMVTRVLLLLSLSWVMGLDKPFLEAFGHAFSGRDLVLIAGGFFLLYKATVEIHEKVEGKPEHKRKARKGRTLASIIAQIVVIDLVFSLDSVITAVGMSNELVIMVLAVIAAVAVMMLASSAISGFVDRHATVKVLALSFLVMIGVALLIEGMGGHINKNYIYFAMGFSVAVEMLNLRMTRKKMLEP
jgi:predicted tellurium resistance membrane protein TerC